MEWTPTQVAALVRTQAETLSLIAEKIAALPPERDAMQSAVSFNCHLAAERVAKWLRAVLLDMENPENSPRVLDAAGAIRAAITEVDFIADVVREI